MPEIARLVRKLRVATLMIHGLLAVVTLLCALPVRLWAAGETAASEGAQKLHTVVLVFPELKPILREVQLERLPRTPSGEERFDAAPYLNKTWLSVAEDVTSAVWLPARGALVVTAPFKALDALQRIFESVDTFEIERYQYTFSVWRFQLDAGADEKPPYLLDDLKKKDSGARVIHTHTLQASSGRPVRGVSGTQKSTPPEPPPKTDPGADAQKNVDLHGARGSSVYIEGVTMSDRRMVEARLEYAVRIPSETVKTDLEMTGETNVFMVAGKDVVVQITRPPQAAASEGADHKALAYAIVIRADPRREGRKFADELDTQIKKEILEELRWEKETIEKAKVR
jgi:hypothetical protein